MPVRADVPPAGGSAMGALKTTGTAFDRREVKYPDSDGKPMAETDLHRDEMLELIAMLRVRYEDRADVYVSGNLFVYYEEGNPAAVVAPDVFVVFGVPSARRRTYNLWLEGTPPAVVIEVTSRRTRREDLHGKRDVYTRLGVAEYFVYDPEADYLQPPLQGHRLEAGRYLPMVPTADGTLRSTRLELDLRMEEGRVALYDADTGERLLRTGEQAAALKAAEAEAARLREDIARLRGEAVGPPAA
jgi:Uma2 family endonuclease